MSENSSVPSTAGKSASAAGRPPLRRPPDAVLAGVCAALAGHFGLDVLLVRLVAVAVLIVSGGSAVLAYLIAWILIPRSAEPAGRSVRVAPAASSRGAWRDAAVELRLLGEALRPVRGGGAPTPGAGPLAAVDAALTGFGDRLRHPDVQDQARRVASGVSAAVDATLDGLDRGKRGEP
jgi:phage shock protein PspC (stress-responsive transcriptional regulator)